MSDPIDNRFVHDRHCDMSSENPISSDISWTFARILSLAVTLGGLILGVWLLIAAHDVLLLAMLAALFAVMLDGGVRTLRAYLPIPRWSALLLLWLVLTAVGIGGSLLLAPQVMTDMEALGERIPQALAQLDNRLKRIDWGHQALDQLSALQASGTLQQTAQRFLGFFSSLLGTVTGTLLVIVLGLFMASEPHTYVRGALRLLPPRWRSRAADVCEATGRALRWWLLARFASMAVVFVLTWIGLLLLGLPLAFLLALIAGLLSFVPTFGPLVAAVPAILVGLSAGTQQALWVGLVYLGIQLVESYGITPFLERRAVRLPPALLVIFQLTMGVLAGALGVLLATPVLVVLMVLTAMLYLENKFGETVDLP